ncbi:MAG: 2-amino-4-hydroxy-6-hydroxymethyldihydropteridine diphosphokinase [Spirochaetales bacterium]|nr:2-amino-4-hydroxy-6-hydroxymethyldihydropteridine diphosphokinase [Spirochaetales bacterium]
MTKNVFLSLGSNLGDRAENIETAIENLKQIGKDLRVSRIYESEPLYYTRQPRFLNAVVCGHFSLSAYKLLTYILKLENKLGRKRNTSQRYGPRFADIDILLYGNTLITQRKLIIPHPRMYERKFVILPLIEIAPTLRDPASGQLFWKYLLKIRDQGVYFHSFSRYTKKPIIYKVL